jgi:poly [ADP-ribose] polymerase 2/3/4
MAKKLKSKKIDHFTNDGFSETIKHSVLFCGNVSGNNNKFYSLEIQKNPSGKYRIFTHYGRLGKTDIYEIRDDYNGPLTDLSFVEEEFDEILSSKLKGKKIKDEDGERIEKYELVDVFAPTVGSENVRGKSVKVVESKIAAKDVVSAYSHPQVSRIIKQIVDENIHNISSLTSLKLTSNGFETPLGPVTKEHIQKSKEPLDILKSLLVDGKLNKSLRSVVDNNNRYFSLIPHPFGHKIQESDWILDDTKLAEEYEMLDNLESAVSMGSALQDTSKQKNILGADIEFLEDEKEFKRIEHYINNSKAHNHHGSDVWKYRVKHVFKIKIPSERNRFESNGSKFNNEKELFHGSKNCNVLSILKNGLIVPPVNSAGVSGRMFGNHLYFACNSTKSMNYCTNFWNRSHSSKNSNIFLFLANVRLGNFLTVHDSTPNGIPSGHDSIWAKAGRGLYNDEFVIKRFEQHTLTFMVELQ